jgi:uncharacterized protein YhbP (UPF0306 family)
MPDEFDVERIVAANSYMVVGTVGHDGCPWVSPVFFAPVGDDRLYWVSSPDSRHSRNIAQCPKVALTVFDSGVAIGRAEAVYFEAQAFRAAGAETAAALDALNARLPKSKQLSAQDLEPAGPLTLYKAEFSHRYVLVRGGDPQQGNTVDITLEV